MAWQGAHLSAPSYQRYGRRSAAIKDGLVKSKRRLQTDILYIHKFLLGCDGNLDVTEMLWPRTRLLRIQNFNDIYAM
jgi:hypothetical protein